MRRYVPEYCACGDHCALSEDKLKVKSELRKQGRSGERSESGTSRNALSEDKLKVKSELRKQGRSGERSESGTSRNALSEEN